MSWLINFKTVEAMREFNFIFLKNLNNIKLLLFNSNNIFTHRLVKIILNNKILEQKFVLKVY